MSALPKSKRAATAALRRTIRGIEEAGTPKQLRLPLGVSRIDRALPGGGLRLGCIHEVAGDEAATGFCAALLARTLGTGLRGGSQAGSPGTEVGSLGTEAENPGSCGAAQVASAPPLGSRARPGALLWLAREEDLYAPGLVRYGIEAGQLLVVSGLHRQRDMLWAMEEALRCRAVRGVVAEMGGLAETTGGTGGIGGIGLVAGRRLMLAAEGTEVLGLVLSRRSGERRRGGAGVPAAVSRWRVRAVPGGEGGRGHGGGGGHGRGRTGPRWHVELLHCRGGRPAEWLVGWGDEGWKALPASDGARPGTRRAG